MKTPNSEKNLQEDITETRLTGVQRLLEVGLIFSVSAALFLLISILTFDPKDPSWTQTGTHNDVHNAAGAIGAWLADVMLFSFGWIAYALPVIMVATGWFIFRKFKSLLTIDYLTLGLRLIGFLLMMIGATSLSSMNFDDIQQFSSGGVIGDVISGSMLPYFNFTGTTLILLSFFFTGITLLTGISWLYVTDFIGEKVYQVFDWLYKKPRAWLLNRQTQEKAEEMPPEETILEKVLAEPTKVETSTLEKEPSLVGLDVHHQAEGLMKEHAEKPKASPERKEPYIEIDQILGDNTRYRELDDTPEDNIPEAIQRFDLSMLTNAPVMSPSEPVQENSQYPDSLELTEDDAPVCVEEEPEFSFEPIASEPMPTAPVQKQKWQDEVSMPTLDLLDRTDKVQNPISQEELDMVSRLVEVKLLDFNIEVKVVDVIPGPVITRFELDLAPGVKVSKISALSKDLARSLSAISVRIVEVIPGKSYIGLEIPNKHREIVRLAEVLSCPNFEKSNSPLTMVLGKDIEGQPVIVDLAKMPHLLVAGTTGSGKSVGVNVMILSLLYKSTPEDVRMIMIDPKMLELSVYEGIPHLLTEVVTDMKEAANALRWCVGEMERRYKLMSALGVRNLKGFNAKVEEAIAAGTPLTDPLWKPSDSMESTAPQLEKLPSIVVVIDEFADMMMIVGKKVEELIARIAQKARAAGIHLVLATQRPSVDVITGLIKANIPTRIAFQVSSKIDSRTILDQQGAENLLGQGDMLYLPPGSGVPTRVHGAFVDDHEVHAVVHDWKQRGEPQYIDEILSGETTEENLLPGEQLDEDSEMDPLYDQVVAFVTESRRASVSGVQRRFRIGYNRAARLVEQLEAAGVVSAPAHNGNREVLAPPPPQI